MGSQVSRRDFLKISGITLLNAAFPALLPGLLPGEPESPIQPQGRALAALPLRGSPRQAAPIISHLFPDSILPLLEKQGEWYRVPQGYVPCAGVQPLLPAAYSSAAAPTGGDWVTVIAPAASVRRWAAADAPLITRVGHGGILQLTDMLPATRQEQAWYALANEHGQRLGWSQAAYWRVCAVPPLRPVPGMQITLDRALHLLTVYRANEVVLTAPAALGDQVTPNTYTLGTRTPTASWLPIESAGATLYGMPYCLAFNGGIVVVGAYWHHLFGAAASGPAVQLSPLLARWLYAQFPDEGVMNVR